MSKNHIYKRIEILKTDLYSDHLNYCNLLFKNNFNIQFNNAEKAFRTVNLCLIRIGSNMDSEEPNFKNEIIINKNSLEICRKYLDQHNRFIEYFLNKGLIEKEINNSPEASDFYSPIDESVFKNLDIEAKYKIKEWRSV